MKKFLSFASAVLICIALLPLFIVDMDASAKQFYKGWSGDTSLSGIEDDCNMFSPSEEQEMTELIQQYAAQLKMNIFIFLAGKDYSSYGDYKTECFADDSYDQRFGEDTDGVYFFMDFSGKVPNYHYISTSGKAVLTYQEHMQSIFSHMKVYMPKSSTDYSDCKEDIRTSVEQFLTVFARYSDRTPNRFSYYYDDDSKPPKYFYYFLGKYYISSRKPIFVQLYYLLIGIVGGTITAFIVYFCVKKNYKFKNATSPGVYLCRDSTHFLHKDDTFLRSHTTHTRIERNTGGGGGGFSGGGGGHGGGGVSHSSGGGHGGGGFST